MVCFRIEDVSGYKNIPRNYTIPFDSLPEFKGQAVEPYIAQEIRKEVNGSKDRILLSYSKSLAVCLLKYNKALDNELHIQRIHDPSCMNSIFYHDSNGPQRTPYSILDWKFGTKPFHKNRNIRLTNFIMDVSDNYTLNQYLLHFTGSGLKARISPEKDNEIVMLQPIDDVFIKEYLDAIYLLYALQLKYGFLKDSVIADEMIQEIYEIDDFRFDGYEHEREVIVFLIQYLRYNTAYEQLISSRIISDTLNGERVSMYCDAILQFSEIMNGDFDDSYAILSDYSYDVVSDIIWKYCNLFLKHATYWSQKSIFY